MIMPQRKPGGAILASLFNDGRDVSPEARLFGATQARAPVAPGMPPMSPRADMLAAAVAGGDMSAPVGMTPGPFAEPTFAPPTGMPQLRQPEVQIPKPKFFDNDGGWRGAVGILGDALAGAVGAPPMYAKMQERRQQEERQDAQRSAEWGRLDRNRAQDRGWAVEDRDALFNKPESFMSGRDRVRYNPATGESQVVYDGPEDYQTYADTLGIDPTDPAYEGAVQDYVLRGNGPTSQQARQSLESQRLAGRLSLKATPTYAATHPRARSGGRPGGGGAAPKSTSAVIAPLLYKMSRGQPLTPAEQATLDYTKPRPRGAAAGGGGGAAGITTIAQGADGRKVGWNGKAWVAVK